MTKKIKDLIPGDRVCAEDGAAVTVMSCERVSWMESKSGQVFEVEYKDDKSEVGGCICSGDDTVHLEKGEHGKN